MGATPGVGHMDFTNRESGQNEDTTTEVQLLFDEKVKAEQSKSFIAFNR